MQLEYKCKDTQCKKEKKTKDKEIEQYIFYMIIKGISSSMSHRKPT